MKNRSAGEKNKNKKSTKKVLVIDEELIESDDNKKKFTKGEKIFLIFSILFIIGCFIFYWYRTYYYYHITHDVVKNITLKDKLTSLNNIAYQNDGLYEKSGYFYFALDIQVLKKKKKRCHQHHLDTLGFKTEVQKK